MREFRGTAQILIRIISHRDFNRSRKPRMLLHNILLFESEIFYSFCIRIYLTQDLILSV